MNESQHPIAVVGMACRLPGAPSLNAYWHLLCNGVDAISEVPAERWSLAEFYDPDPATPCKTPVRWGSFLDDIDRFDAAFFGISPREAASMSPLQRLLLEVTWQAVENAGIRMSDLSARQAAEERRTGVFMGVASFDYYDRIAQDPTRVDGYALTGNAFSVAANRLSYVFDLHGPSVAIDTACSSSLVSIHLACQSLAAGECSVALAGGSQIKLSPWVTVAASKGGFLSPDGRCKTFDQRANGYARGEGIGVVVLKRLDDALRDNDPIWAVIRGSAVNQDGHSNGLTAPNPVAQVDVIGTALRRARIPPDQIGYFEAHGTGTRLGDLMELNAIGSVLEGRKTNCLVGSVKTNLGHLEAAAGVAGFIKAALCIHHREIVPHLHLQQPSSLIDFDRLSLTVPTRHQPWPSELPRIAGINSFGFGGTNAHVVIEAAPEPRAPADPAPGPALLCLSARSRQALAALADDYADWLHDHPDASLNAVAATLANGRDIFNERRALVCDSTSDAVARLNGIAADLRAGGEPGPGGATPRVALLFTGQGAQYPGMGGGLLERFAVYRDTWRQADAALADTLGGPLSQFVHGSKATEAVLAQTRHTQLALYVLQIGLGRMLLECGVQPAFVLGHSVGEFAAATFAGVLTFEDGLRLVAQRASSMQACRADGAMTAVQTDRRSASAVLERLGSGAVIAAVNSPRNVVLSGPVSDIEAAEQVLNAQDVPHRRLEVSHAFHSRAMAPAAHTLRDFATQVPHGPATLPMVSSTTGAVLTDDVVWPDYWADQLLKPVEFDLAVTRLAQEKPDLVLEVGPRPVLSRLVHGRFGAATRVYNTLNPVSDDLTVVLRALGACFEAGVDLRAAAIHPADGTPRLRLPGYAFEPQRHRLYAPVRMPRAEGSAAAAGLQHAFLADATVKSTDQNGFSVSVPIGTRRFAYLGDHTVFGADVLPATGHIGLAQAAAYQITGNRHWRLQDLEFRRPLVLEADDRRVRVDVIADSDAQFRFLVIDDDGQPTPSVSSRSVYSCGVLTACPPMEEESA